jgi:predicted acyl esterase
MKRKITSSLLLMLAFLGLHAQTAPNGQFDDIFDLSTKFNVQIPMRDGVKLSTDLWLPITSDSLVLDIDVLGNTYSLELIPKGVQLAIYPQMIDANGDTVANPNPYQLPMIFTRTPYNKRDGGAGPVVSILGYIYGYQDMRGRYDSEGAYIPMYPDAWDKRPYINTQHVLDSTDANGPLNANRHEDGWDTYQYILNDLFRDYDLDGDGVVDVTDLYMNGSIGMFGASALGNTQYQLAAAHYVDPNGPGLKALLPIVATNEHFKSTGFNNGVYRRTLVGGWVRGQLDAALTDDPAIMAVDNTIFNNIHTPKDYGFDNVDTVIKYGVDHFSVLKYDQPITSYYPNTIFRANMDASFAPVDEFGEGDANGMFSRYTNMNVPAYHLTGWWDIFIDGQIETFNLMRDNVTGPAKNLQKLVIGPWAHQTVGGLRTGDITYKDNVQDLIGVPVDDIDLDNLNLEGVLNSELVAWFRDRLNYNGHVKLLDPIYRIPEGKWQALGTTGQFIKIPAVDYDLTFQQLVNFLVGAEGLPQVPISIDTNGDGVPNFSVSIDAPTLDVSPIGGGAVNELVRKDFNQVADVRFYVVGPINDGVDYNDEVGNYWFETDSFPLPASEITYTDLYLHQNARMNTSAPTQNEGFNSYINDPDFPWHGWSVGGNNMIVPTPQDDRDSQGQFNLADPRYRTFALENQSIIGFETPHLADTVCMIGFPKMTLFAKAETLDGTTGPTDCDFFVRIVDVYPDGREYFVTEGAVNARAREYARSLFNGAEDINAPYSNINLGQVYKYEFEVLPIAYTFGKGHRIKVLVQSKNFPRYQINPQIPIEDGDFFRRDPLDGKTYVYNGVEYAPRTLSFGVAFSPEHPSHISLPLYKSTVGFDVTSIAELKPEREIKVMPNPTKNVFNILMDESAETNYVLYNTLGQAVKNGRFNSLATQVNVENLNSGIYILHVDQQGTKFSTKIVIE